MVNLRFELQRLSISSFISGAESRHLPGPRVSEIDGAEEIMHRLLHRFPDVYNRRTCTNVYHERERVTALERDSRNTRETETISTRTRRKNL